MTVLAEGPVHHHPTDSRITTSGTSIPWMKSSSISPYTAKAAALQETETAAIARAAMDTRMQLIDQENRFALQPLTDSMRARWRLLDRGLDYNVLSIFGIQSTGKSTGEV